MELTVDYKEGVRKDIRENSEMARAYYCEAMQAIADGENEVARVMLDDLASAGLVLL